MTGKEDDPNINQDNNLAKKGQLDKLEMIRKLRDLPDDKLKEVLELVKENASKGEEPSSD